MPAGQDWGLTLTEVTRQFSGLWVVEGVPRLHSEGSQFGACPGVELLLSSRAVLSGIHPKEASPQHSESERLRLAEAPSKLSSLERGQPEGSS